MYLELSPRRIQAHEDVPIRLENRGDVELLTGLDDSIERWDGHRWVLTSTPEVPAVGLVLEPGESSEEMPDWPGQFRQQDAPTPGIYRVTKTAACDGPSQLQLSADSHLEVVPSRDSAHRRPSTPPTTAS
jgi:hypothetical protein